MLGWQRRRNELLDEIESHIEIETEQNIENGMPPNQARQAAQRKFGNVLVTVERSRRVWGGLRLENLGRDFQYAIRSLKTVPGYTAALVCTLALGMGCVTAMLAIVQSVLLRPVDLPDPGQLVAIYAENGPKEGNSAPRGISYASIEELRRDTNTFASVSGYNTIVQPVETADSLRAAPLVGVTPGFFQTLAVSARFGRLIGPEDASAQVAVLSDEFWHERLQGIPNAVGSTIAISGRQWTVIGVLPPGFHSFGMTGAPTVFLPLSLVSTHLGPRGVFKVDSAMVIGRLKHGVSIEQARTDAQNILTHGAGAAMEKQRVPVIRSYQEFVAGEMHRPLWALLGAALFLLLIACVNAANLQIGRTASRMPEVAIRSVLGAGLGRLMQQLIIENVVVSMSSAALAGGLSFLVVAAVRQAYGDKYPRFDEIAVHPLVLFIACFLAVVVGIVISVVPALSSYRKMISCCTERTVTRSSRLPGLLVASQVALTCVLLVTTGLFMRTLQSLENVQLGFDPRGITTLVLMPENQQQDPQLSRQIETRLLRKFETLPGIQSVTMQSEIPFSDYHIGLRGNTDVSGRPYQKGDSANYSFVSTNFVQTSGVRLLQGRGFIQGDESNGAIAVLVNEAFVRMFLTDRQPLSAILRFHRDQGNTSGRVPFTEPMTIVGVVQNEFQGGNLGAPFEPMVYLNYLALPKTSFLSAVFSASAQYAVRSNLPESIVASELRAAVKQEAPAMAEMSLKRMEESISKSLGERRLALRLVSGFSIVALLLSAIGIYGVLAYSVSQRRREIGIRMALGSTQWNAAGLVAGQTGKMVLLGLLPGVVGAWVTGHTVVRSFLFGVKAWDAETFAVAGAVLLLVSATAAFLPALRATQIDPIETLRAE